MSTWGSVRRGMKKELVEDMVREGGLVTLYCFGSEIGVINCEAVISAGKIRMVVLDMCRIDILV